MNTAMVCFVCPNSCRLMVTQDSNAVNYDSNTVNNDSNAIDVENNRCPRGVEFARKELTDPERILTSTIRVTNGALPLVSVRSDAPVKKGELKNIVKQLDKITVEAPIVSGQILLSSSGKNKVSIIATRTIEKAN
jgi:CxxC motif-containing protein